MIRRREFITLLGSSAASPIAASAQQDGKTIHIGYLGASLNSPSTAAAYQAFLSELLELYLGFGF
jgi:hypothetical protein